MLGQGSNQWAMDRVAAGESAPEFDFVDEAMRDQLAAGGTTMLQVRYLDYERSLAIKGNACYCGAPYAENGMCTLGSDCPRQELGRGHWHSALRRLEQMSEG